MRPFFEKQDTSKFVQRRLDFSFLFSGPVLGWRNLFSSSGIFRRGRSQPGCTRTFWRAEGTSQAGLGPSDQEKVPASLSLSLQSEKILSLLYVRKGHLSTGHSVIWDLSPRLVEASTCFPLASHTDLKSLKGLYSGPSPIRKVPVDWSAGSYDFVRILCKVILDNWPKIYTVKISTVLYGWWWSASLGSLED
jgi:hypothetical protein